MLHADSAIDALDSVSVASSAFPGTTLVIFINSKITKYYVEHIFNKLA